MYLVKVIKESIAGTGISKVNTTALIVNEAGHYMSKNFQIMNYIIGGCTYDKFGSPIAFTSSPLRAQRIVTRLNKYGTHRIFSFKNKTTLAVAFVIGILVAFSQILLWYLNIN